jgi:DNA gyrase/topoisomerase IV subunit B
LNKIIDFQEENVEYIYQPHTPMYLLNNQNIINLSNKNTSELKKLLKYISGKDQPHMPSALELILDTYNSTMKITAFRNHGLLMDKSLLNNTMDFNMMSIIDHSIQSEVKLSLEMIFAYLDD